jgi:hypothetical protein
VTIIANPPNLAATILPIDLLVVYFSEIVPATPTDMLAYALVGYCASSTSNRRAQAGCVGVSVFQDTA